MDQPNADARRPTPAGDTSDAADPLRGGIEAAGTALPALPPGHLLEAIARELATGTQSSQYCSLVRLRFEPTVPITRRREVVDRIGRAITVHDGVQRDGPVPMVDLLIPDRYEASPLVDSLAGIAEIDGAVVMSSIPVRP